MSTTTSERPTTLRPLNSLSDVAGQYRTIFCDVWGVVHDGVAKHVEAEVALTAARNAGARIVLLTNSPRPSAGVMVQLDALAFSRDAYDSIVTSGDATRALIADIAGPVLHLGPARDVDLFEGQDVALVAEDDAEAVVCTGLVDDEKETPADYAEVLKRLSARGLPMICANPDIVVHRGDRLVYCSGALARDYAAFGGIVRLAGKPHKPIYDVAAKAADAVPGEPILAIGDGLMTDIKGANEFGVDALLITDGIHGEEFGGPEPDIRKVANALAGRGLSARYYMPALV